MAGLSHLLRGPRERTHHVSDRFPTLRGQKLVDAKRIFTADACPKPLTLRRGRMAFIRRY